MELLIGNKDSGIWAVIICFGSHCQGILRCDCGMDIRKYITMGVGSLILNMVNLDCVVKGYRELNLGF